MSTAPKNEVKFYQKLDRLLDFDLKKTLELRVKRDIPVRTKFVELKWEDSVGLSFKIGKKPFTIKATTIDPLLFDSLAEEDKKFLKDGEYADETTTVRSFFEKYFPEFFIPLAFMKKSAASKEEFGFLDYVNPFSKYWKSSLYPKSIPALKRKRLNNGGAGY